jgi:ATP-dependent DNA helicase RecG
VVLVLPGGKANLHFVRLIVEESQQGRPLRMEELLVLNRLWQERRLSTAEVARLIQKPEPEARYLLQQLVEAGLVEARGERKGRTWRLSAATYRRLDRSAAYVRQRGFEPIQQEQMVVSYVMRHGSISRKEISELCQLSPEQSYRLLKRLEKAGKIRQIGGKTKGARYGLVND